MYGGYDSHFFLRPNVIFDAPRPNGCTMLYLFNFASYDDVTPLNLLARGDTI